MKQKAGVFFKASFDTHLSCHETKSRRESLASELFQLGAADCMEEARMAAKGFFASMK